MKVFVYYNLHKKCWSIKSMQGPDKGRVIGYTDVVLLKNCIFKVSQKGRERVLREQRKNVHAGVLGFMVDSHSSLVVDCEVTYNPYKYSSFVKAADSTPIEYAEGVLLINKKVYTSQEMT